ACLTPRISPRPKAAYRDASIKISFGFRGARLESELRKIWTFRLSNSKLETRNGRFSPAGQRLAGLRADPHLAPLEDFLLPDRHGLFYLFDREAAGLKGVVAVRRGDGDHDAGFG